MLATPKQMPAAAAAAAAAAGTPFAAAAAQQQQQQCRKCFDGCASPPASSNSSGASTHMTTGGQPQQQQQQPASPAASSGSRTPNSAAVPAGAAATQHQAASPAASSGSGSGSGLKGAASMLAGAMPAAPAAAAAAPAAALPTGPPPASASREWLYRLVTFPAYFTPCPACCGGARAPRREQLMTQFDSAAPYPVYCSTCPGFKERATSGALLQVRRSAFKDVVKASEIQDFGADVAGVQQYTLNSSKVIYLNREATPEKKGANTNAAPASCSVDGRAMMDKASSYCSLKCKMVAEDPGFSVWLDGQDPSVRILAAAAANAPPRPTLASKRGPAPADSTTSSGEDGSASGVGLAPSSATGSGHSGASSRPAKCARAASASLADAGLAASAQASRRPSAAPQLQRATSAQAVTPAPAGLKRIRISLPGSSKNRQHTKAAAASGAGRAGRALPAAPAAPALTSGSGSWLDLDAALSGAAAWDSWDMDSPCATADAGGGGLLSMGAAAMWEGDGSMSPALIHAPSCFAACSCDDWGLAGSPLERTFTSAGMGALINTACCALPAGSDDSAASLLARTASESTDAEGSALLALHGMHCW